MDTVEELFQYLEDNAADCVVSFIPFQLAQSIGSFLNEHKSTLETDQISNLNCECKAFLRASLERNTEGDSVDITFTPVEYKYIKTRIIISIGRTGNSFNFFNQAPAT
jgi:hypothetical protein